MFIYDANSNTDFLYSCAHPLLLDRAAGFAACELLVPPPSSEDADRSTELEAHHLRLPRRRGWAHT